LCWQRLLCGHKLCLSAENTECHSDSATERASESQRGPYYATKRQLSGLMPADPRSPGPAIARPVSWPGSEARWQAQAVRLRVAPESGVPGHWPREPCRVGGERAGWDVPGGAKPGAPHLAGAGLGRGPRAGRLGPSLAESPGPGRGAWGSWPKRLVLLSSVPARLSVLLARNLRASTPHKDAATFLGGIYRQRINPTFAQMFGG
jgi:hypothetical protein